MKVIKIGAVWCNGCLVMKPRWQEVEDENPWLMTEYLDYDEDREKIKNFNIDISKLPVFIFLDKEGVEIDRLEGEIEKKKLVQLIGNHRER